MNSRRLVPIALVSILVAGCVRTTQIESRKAASYSAEPKRVFVVTNVGSDFGQDFGDEFKRRLTAIAKDCGADLELIRTNPGEHNVKALYDRMKAFDADTLLTIHRTGGTRNQYGLLHAIYAVKMFDVASESEVWSAGVGFYRGGIFIPIEERGKALAIDITHKMKEDAIFRSCRSYAPRSGD